MCGGELTGMTGRITCKDAGWASSSIPEQHACEGKKNKPSEGADPAKTLG